MPDPHATRTAVSLSEKLAGARALREIIRKHRDETDETRQFGATSRGSHGQTRPLSCVSPSQRGDPVAPVDGACDPQN